MSEAVKNVTKKIFWTEREREDVIKQALILMLKARCIFPKYTDPTGFNGIIPLHEAVDKAQQQLLFSERCRSETAIRLDCNNKNSLLRKTADYLIREDEISVLSPHLFESFELASLGTGTIGLHLRIKGNVSKSEEQAILINTRRKLGENIPEVEDQSSKASAKIFHSNVRGSGVSTPSTSLDSIVETLAANVAKSFEETLRLKLESVSADLVVSFEESLKTKLNDVSNRLLDEYSTLVTAKRNEISALIGNNGGHEVSAEAGKVGKERLCKVLVLGPIPTQVNALQKEFENCLDLRFASNEASAGRISKQAKYVDAILVMTDKVSHAMQDAIKKHPNRILCKGGVSALKDQLTGIYADYQA